MATMELATVVSIPIQVMTSWRGSHPFIRLFHPSRPLSDTFIDVLGSFHPTALEKVLVTVALASSSSTLTSTRTRAYERQNRMPQSSNEEVYIPYISDEYPSSFPPGDNDEGQAWTQWQSALNPDKRPITTDTWTRLSGAIIALPRVKGRGGPNSPKNSPQNGFRRNSSSHGVVIKRASELHHMARCTN